MCVKVHNTLGFGFLEAVYQNALMMEFQKAVLRQRRKKNPGLCYDNQVVAVPGQYYHGEKVIVELKSVKDLHLPQGPAHKSLASYRYRSRILIDFSER